MGSPKAAGVKECPYLFAVEVEEEIVDITAQTPKEAGAKVAGARDLEAGSVVVVCDRTNTWRRYKVGRHPRALRPAGVE